MNLADSLFIRKLHDSGPPLTEADVADFELEVGSRLPPVYRELLLLRNGGRFYQPMVYPASPPAECNDELGIGILFRLLKPSDPDRNTRGLRRNFQTYRDRIAPNTLPIADSGEDLLLIDLSRATAGAVWVWERDYELSRNPADNRILVTQSFGDLVAKCRPAPSYYSSLETEEPFVAIEHFDLDGLRRFLDAGLSPDARNEEDVTLLVLACRESNFDAAELLLSRGADPNLPELRWGYSPLFHASRVYEGAADLVKLLLRYGAKPEDAIREG